MNPAEALATGWGEDGAWAVGDEGVDLLERARHFRELADRLESKAHRRDSVPRAPGAGWVRLVYGDWRAERSAAGRRIRDRSDAGRDCCEHTVVALTSALLGDVEWSRLAAARAEAVPHGQVGSAGLALSRAVSWMAAGELRLAAQVLLDEVETLASGGPATHESALIISLTAELAARAGRTREARRVLEGRADRVTTDPLIRRELAMADAFLADDGIEAMVRWIGQTPPAPSFALGRAHLWIGTLLRRRRDKLRALAHLRVAADHLQANGRGPWLSAAMAELRASGAAGEPRSGKLSGLDELTEQQAAIARLAARGLSNREIGDRLFLSPRTVGSHLYRIFPKLGVTSRHQLAGLVAGIDSPHG